MFSIIDATTMNSPITQDEPFRFLDLPQELQLEIIKLHYLAQEITITFSPEIYETKERKLSEPPTFIGSPDASLLLTCKHVYATAEPISTKAPLTIRVPSHPRLGGRLFWRWLHKLPEDHKLSNGSRRVVGAVFVTPDFLDEFAAPIKSGESASPMQRYISSRFPNIQTVFYATK